MTHKVIIATTAAVLGLLLALTGGAVGAGKSFTLMGQKDTPTAKGTATVDGQHLKVTASGLKPNAVYTVWLVNMKPTMTKAPAGKEPPSFKTDAKGNGKYEGNLNESPIGKWESIMIVRHPSGDAKDMDRMEDALMAKLM